MPSSPSPTSLSRKDAQPNRTNRPEPAGNISTFEIRIPANRFGAATKESCSDSKTGSHGPSKNTRKVPLIGQVPARGAANFDQVLTFKGKLGSVRSPQLRGKETLTTDLGDANNPAASRPVKVTIEWQFAAGGR